MNGNLHRRELIRCRPGGLHQSHSHVLSSLPADLESTLSSLESVHKFESVLREIYDTHHGRCEPSVAAGRREEEFYLTNLESNRHVL